MRTRSKLAGLGILVWALALPGTASAQNRTVVSNGPFAQVFWCNEENFCGAVFVFSDGTAQAPTIFLSYSIIRLNDDASITEVEEGYGHIPPADVAVTGSVNSGKQKVALNVDTSELDPRDFEIVAGSGGPISITCRQNGEFWVKQNGTSEEHFGVFTEHRSGSSEFAEGEPTGTVVSFPPSVGTLCEEGRNQNVTVLLQQAH